MKFTFMKFAIALVLAGVIVFVVLLVTKKEEPAAPPEDNDFQITTFDFDSLEENPLLDISGDVPPDNTEISKNLEFPTDKVNTTKIQLSFQNFDLSLGGTSEFNILKYITIRFNQSILNLVDLTVNDVEFNAEEGVVLKTDINVSSLQLGELSDIDIKLTFSEAVNVSDITSIVFGTDVVFQNTTFDLEGVGGLLQQLEGDNVVGSVDIFTFVTLPNLEATTKMQLTFTNFDLTAGGNTFNTLTSIRIEFQNQLLSLADLEINDNAISSEGNLDTNLNVSAFFLSGPGEIVIKFTFNEPHQISEINRIIFRTEQNYI